MKFAQTFIKHHVMTILLYILVVVFGFTASRTCRWRSCRPWRFRQRLFTLTYPGAGPEDIEQQVTKNSRVR